MSSSSSSSGRYYCHECATIFSHGSPENGGQGGGGPSRSSPTPDEIQCTSCGSGFVEELEPGAENQDSGVHFGIGGGLPPGVPPGVPPGLPQGLANLIFGGAIGGGGGSQGHIPFVFGGPQGGGGGRRSNQEPSPPGVENRPPVNPGDPREWLNEFINNLTGGLGGVAGPAIQIGIHGGVGGNPSDFNMFSNPGDYVFGRGGIDAIVTQLLNQMDGAGAPPLPKENIESIPTVQITQDQVDSKLQCSVCWEDFKISEDVRALKCEHFFHDECIVPWLKLHGTCPVCRKPQGEAGEDRRDDRAEADGGGGSEVIIESQNRNPSDSTSQQSITNGNNPIANAIVNQILGGASGNMTTMTFQGPGGARRTVIRPRGFGTPVAPPPSVNHPSSTPGARRQSPPSSSSEDSSSDAQRPRFDDNIDLE